jgi:translation initiation factor 4A
MAEDLLEKDDIVCSSEVFEMECETFDDMGGDEGLKEKLLQGIYAYGFENPARIQSLAIPQIIAGREILAQSQSGTGKTGAFVISALQLIDEKIKAPQAIILSPTCELAQQTYIVARSIGSFMKDVHYSYTVGGADRTTNIKELGGMVGNRKLDENSVAQLVVATPGRLKDILAYNPELFDNTKILIIDECDELLHGTFKQELKTIIGALPTDIKICLFSATLNTDVVALAEIILKNPVKILIKKERITLNGIKQTYVKINHPDEKIVFLLDMLATLPIQQFIVYVNSKENARRLKEQLEKENYAVMTINSSNTKIERAEIIRDFKKGGAKCLISTDLLSRGIDIQQLSLIINYDLPRADNIDAYVHRIGRVGRYGRSGIAINLVGDYDKDVQNLISLTFKCPILPLKEDFLKDL